MNRRRRSSLVFLLTTLLLTTTSVSRKAPERVLLSSVKALTLRQGLLTTHNRVAAIPQLQCIGGNAKGLYDIDLLRCKNQGSSYGDEDIQWTCSASLPSEFKLGSTDVICEGFKSSDDPYVLKGSCGVEYRLMLTDIGQDRYGKQVYRSYETDGGKSAGKLVTTLFWLVFFAVLLWIIYAAFFRNNAQRRPGYDRPGFFGGGGAGGNDDPPPPYDYHPPPPKPKTYSRAVPARGQAGLAPGFWTGALGGVVAGYAAGNRGQARNPNSSMFHGDNGEGSSRWGSGGRSSSSSGMASSPGGGSSRHESSGFGGTNRR